MTSVSRKVLKDLADSVRKNSDKLTDLVIPDNMTTVSNVIKTANLRIDVHKDSRDPDKAVAKIQANGGATDNTVKNYIKSGNSGGSGTHKGTHKNIVVIPFDKTAFDVEDFAKKIEDA